MKRQAGYSIAEALVVLALTGVVLGTVAMYLEPAEVPLETGADLVEGEMRSARLRAIATTSARKVTAASSTRLIGHEAASCSSTTWTADSDLTLDLPDGVSMANTSWSVCFGSRGVSTTNTAIKLTHPKYGALKVEVLIGGTTRVIEE